MLNPGMILSNRYEIIELIGTGGMSEVYKAKCHVLNRYVAIKVLSKVDDIGFVKLTNQDVVRHPLVQKIVKAYENYEAKEQSGGKRNNRGRGSRRQQ